MSFSCSQPNCKLKRNSDAKSKLLRRVYQFNLDTDKSLSQYVQCSDSFDCTTRPHQNELPQHYQHKHPNLKQIQKWRVLKRIQMMNIYGHAKKI